MGAQVMMQHWRMYEFKDLDMTKNEPLFVRGRVLLQQTADFLCAGLLDGMPFRFDDPDKMAAIGAGADALLVLLTFDRVSANWSTARWIWQVPTVRRIIIIIIITSTILIIIIMINK